MIQLWRRCSRCATPLSLLDFRIKHSTQNYETMFKQNESTTFYLQSKVVRAKQRIEAELAAERERCVQMCSLILWRSCLSSLGGQAATAAGPSQPGSNPPPP